MKRATEQLRIKDFSDREILAVIADLQNGDGYAKVGDLAPRLFGLSETESSLETLDHAARCVTSRLAWMRRYGLVEKGEEAGFWCISEWGKQLRFTPLGRSLSSAITNTPEGSLLELTHQVADRMKERSVAGRAMRREFQFQVARRRWS